MLIIVEGPDGAGKTQLTKRLTTVLGTYPTASTTLIHRGPPTCHPLDEYVVPLLDYVPGRDRHIICDRWHLGEWVYPKMLDRKTKMDAAVFAYVELFLEARGALVVVLNPPLGVLKHRVAHRTERSNLETDIRLEEARDSFFPNEFPRSVAYRHTWLFDTVITEFDVEDIIIAAKQREEAAHRAVTHPLTVGPWNPYAMIVGDVRGCNGIGCHHHVVHETNGTVFMPYPATSGHYIMRALHEPDVIQLTNACDTEDVKLLWESQGRPCVVALGRSADKRLTDVGVPHATVPHPQYIRRFHHASAKAYGELIDDLIGTERNELKWRP